MTGNDFWSSTNSGSSFTRSAASSGKPHADHHHVATDPVTPSKIYTLTDGGIYRSTTRGASGSWVFLGDGITNVEFYDGVAAPTNAGLMIAGTQDNGTLKATSGNAVWAKIKDGDGGTVDIDPTNPSILYAMHQYVNSVSRSSDGGGTFTLTTNGLIGGNQCGNLHFQVHPSRPATLFLSCLGVWRTLDSASNWSLNFVPPQSHNAMRTAIDGPANTVYAGTNAGEIFMAPGGGSWRSVYEHPDRLVLTDLEINLADPSRLYASFNGSGPGRIIRLVRSSGDTFTPRDITSDLPAGRVVRTIAIDKNYPLTIYAGTDRGVFQGRSTDHGLSWFWRPYNNGMPLADVRDLEVHPAAGIMRAFTHGRSAFEVMPSKYTGGEGLRIEGCPEGQRRGAVGPRDLRSPRRESRRS